MGELKVTDGTSSSIGNVGDGKGDSSSESKTGILTLTTLFFFKVVLVATMLPTLKTMH